MRFRLSPTPHRDAACAGCILGCSLCAPRRADGPPASCETPTGWAVRVRQRLPPTPGAGPGMGGGMRRDLLSGCWQRSVLERVGLGARLLGQLIDIHWAAGVGWCQPHRPLPPRSTRRTLCVTEGAGPAGGQPPPQWPAGAPSPRMDKTGSHKACLSPACTVATAPIPMAGGQAAPPPTNPPSHCVTAHRGPRAVMCPKGRRSLPPLPGPPHAPSQPSPMPRPHPPDPLLPPCWRPIP